MFKETTSLLPCFGANIVCGLISFLMKRMVIFFMVVTCIKLLDIWCIQQRPYLLMMLMRRFDSTVFTQETNPRIWETVLELTGMRLNKGSAHIIECVLLSIWENDEHVFDTMYEVVLYAHILNNSNNHQLYWDQY